MEKKILEKSGNFVSPEKWEPCEKVTSVDRLIDLDFSDITSSHGNNITRCVDCIIDLDFSDVIHCSEWLLCLFVLR